MREIRSSGSVEGVVSNHDPYSDLLLIVGWLKANAGPSAPLKSASLRMTAAQGETPDDCNYMVISGNVVV
jgi:hypothetical protein